MSYLKDRFLMILTAASFALIVLMAIGLYNSPPASLQPSAIPPLRYFTEEQENALNVALNDERLINMLAGRNYIINHVSTFTADEQFGLAPYATASVQFVVYSASGEVDENILAYIDMRNGTVSFIIPEKPVTMPRR